MDELLALEQHAGDAFAHLLVGVPTTLYELRDGIPALRNVGGDIDQQPLAAAGRGRVHQEQRQVGTVAHERLEYVRHEQPEGVGPILLASESELAQVVLQTQAGSMGIVLGRLVGQGRHMQVGGDGHVQLARAVVAHAVQDTPVGQQRGRRQQGVQAGQTWPVAEVAQVIDDVLVGLARHQHLLVARAAHLAPGHGPLGLEQQQAIGQGLHGTAAVGPDDPGQAARAGEQARVVAAVLFAQDVQQRLRGFVGLDVGDVEFRLGHGGLRSGGAGPSRLARA